MSIEDLEVAIFRFVSIAEENCDEEWFKEMDKAGVELTNAVHELKQYKDKEEQGLMIKLPCKVGDTVHICLVTGIKNHDLIYGIFEAKVTRFILDSSCLCYEMVTTDENKWRYEFTVEAFGKTVFLTDAEAEEALAKMGGK